MEGRALITTALLAGPQASGVATTMSVAPIMWPILEKAGYSPNMAAGLISAGGIGAVISPPLMGATAFLIIMRETPSPEHREGRATGQPSRGTARLGPARFETRRRPGSGSERLQLGEKDGHIRGRSRWFVRSAGSGHAPAVPAGGAGVPFAGERSGRNPQLALHTRNLERP